MSETRIFVYGSLLPGLHNYSVISPFIATVKPGRIRGRLVDAGPYPALIADEWRTVRGMWVTVTSDALPRLDRLEEFYGIEENNDYERVWTSDVDDPEWSGWVYIWPHSRGCPVLDTDWWPDVAHGKGIEP